MAKKEPWPAEGMKLGSSITDYHWGYLTTADDGQFSFEADPVVPPTETAIMARWGFYLMSTAGPE